MWTLRSSIVHTVHRVVGFTHQYPVWCKSWFWPTFERTCKNIPLSGSFYCFVGIVKHQNMRVLWKSDTILSIRTYHMKSMSFILALSYGWLSRGADYYLIFSASPQHISEWKSAAIWFWLTCTLLMESSNFLPDLKSVLLHYDQQYGFEP